jgi:hypothetical protein
MGPTVFREGALPVLLLSREEERLHIHVQSEGEAKYWLEPSIGLARN